jgi:hypothetical protein
MVHFSAPSLSYYRVIFMNDVDSSKIHPPLSVTLLPTNWSSEQPAEDSVEMDRTPPMCALLFEKTLLKLFISDERRATTPPFKA